MRNTDFYLAQEKMICDQIVHRGIFDNRVLHAIRSVPRHLFVPEEYQNSAYNDCPLPIGFGQTISQPFIVAYMVSLLQIKLNAKVLEIGTGCGYQTAILAHLASTIVSLEIIPGLAKSAEQTIRGLKLENIRIIIGDGSLGWPNEAPFDSILMSAAAPRVPKPLLAQLADGGRLILPVGDRGFQHIEIWHRIGSNFSKIEGIPVAFVPLRGKYGCKEV